MIIIDDHIATRGDTGIKVVKNLIGGIVKIAVGSQDS
jgi:hypothetical protein